MDWKSIQAAFPAIDTANFKVINKSTKKELAWQLERMEGNDVVNLLVQVDLPSKEKLALQLQKGKSAPVPIKTYGRYVPERKDDFAWENDKIAFRMYGKELELVIRSVELYHIRKRILFEWLMSKQIS